MELLLRRWVLVWPLLLAILQVSTLVVPVRAIFGSRRGTAHHGIAGRHSRKGEPSHPRGGAFQSSVKPTGQQQQQTQPSMLSSLNERTDIRKDGGNSVRLKKGRSERTRSIDLSMSQTVSPHESVQIEEKRAKDIEGESTELESIDQNAATVVGGGGGGGGSNKNVVALITAGLGFSTATVAAKMGLLGEGSYASNALIGQDLGSAFLCAILGAAFVKLNTVSVAQKWLEPRDARKVIHTLSGPLFMLFWPIFSSEPGARAFASVVPLVNAVRLVTAAYGDEADLATAISRSGDKKEALGGPFLYVLVLLAATSLFWTDSLVGVIAVSTMAAGDGMADIVGRRLGEGNRWPFSKKKSIAGSAAFVIASTACSVALTAWMGYTGVLGLPLGGDMIALSSRIALISTICAGVELIPLGDDNWTVPLCAALLSMILLH
eukprot:scaffold128691_cov57-Attheya_sp.AAC.1